MCLETKLLAYNYLRAAIWFHRYILFKKFLITFDKLCIVQSSLSTSEEECNHLRQICETAQKELDMMTEKHDEQVKEVERLQHNLEVCYRCSNVVAHYNHDMVAT